MRTGTETRMRSTLIASRVRTRPAGCDGPQRLNKQKRSCHRCQERVPTLLTVRPRALRFFEVPSEVSVPHRSPHSSINPIASRPNSRLWRHRTLLKPPPSCHRPLNPACRVIGEARPQNRGAAKLTLPVMLVHESTKTACLVVSQIFFHLTNRCF